MSISRLQNAILRLILASRAQGRVLMILISDIVSIILVLGGAGILPSLALADLRVAAGLERVALTVLIDLAVADLIALAEVVLGLVVRVVSAKSLNIRQLLRLNLAAGQNQLARIIPLTLKKSSKTLAHPLSSLKKNLRSHTIKS